MKFKRNRSFTSCLAFLLAFLAVVVPVWAGPIFTTQPVQRQVVAIKATAALSVSASGSGTLSYQWFHNGLAISGGTSSTLTLNAVKYADAGAYQVKVTDSTGISTSNAGFLNVLENSSAVVAWGEIWNGTGYSRPILPNGLSGVVALAAGDAFSVALKTDGTVTAWGDNWQGQTAVPSGLNSVVAIAAGCYHSLALKSDGTLAAWGNNMYGQCTVPANATGVVAVAAGDYHSVALKSDGTVVAWGSTQQTSVPAGLSGVIAIAAGDYHSLALKTDGSVIAWGDNTHGQCTVPPGLSGIVAIAAGYYHSVALKSDGTVVVWGDNSYGQCTIPTGLSSVTAIAAGYYHSLALKSDGTVAAWGSNWHGESSIAVDLNGVIAIAARASYGLALQQVVTPSVLAQPISATVNPGGSATFSITAAGGQLGYQWRKDGQAINSGTGISLTVCNAQKSDAGNYDVIVTNSRGTVTSQIAILNVVGPTLSTQPLPRNIVASGSSVTLSVTASGDGTLSFQWFHNGLAIEGGTSSTLTLNNVKYFDNGAYQVKATDSTGTTASAVSFVNVMAEPSAVVAWGDNSYGQSTIPETLASIVAVAGGDTHSVALKSDGTVTMWGHKGSGFYMIPFGLNGVVAIASGADHSLALKSDGTVVAWGDNSLSQSTVPSRLGGIVAIAAGTAHSLALKSDGTVVAWGDNSASQCNIPPGLTSVIAIAAGNSHSLALKSDGTVMAWGDNSASQCSIPDGLSGIVAIAGGGTHSLALKSDGTVMAWGDNSASQCSLPTGLKNVVAIAGGGTHSLALKSDGTVMAWGDNSASQCSLPTGLRNVVAISGGRSHTLALEEGLEPLIVTQPLSATLNSGETAVFSVIATGGQLSYQWRKNSVPIIGGTAATYTLSNVQRVDEGGYDVIVSNPAGTATSELATLALHGPTIRLQPKQRQVGVVNGNMTLSVSATGTGELSYQWFHNGVVIAGGTSSMLSLTNTKYSASGAYQVKVTDANGTTATSTTAFVNVVIPSAVVAWGDNSYGKSTVPSNLGNIVAIAAGGQHSLALNADGTVVAWGANYYQQTTVPANLSGVVAIGAGSDHSLALKSDGTVVAWGDNSLGQTNIPPGLNHVIAISVGSTYNLALKDDGTVVAWGSQNTSTLPSELCGIIGISAGSSHSVALKSDGTVVAWGDNYYGQCTVPPEATGVIAVAANKSNSSVALTSGGTVVAWGDNYYGQISVPGTLNGAVAISAGGGFNLALKSDGTVAGWGYWQQASIPDGLSSVVAIAAGGSHSLALRALPKPIILTQPTQRQAVAVGGTATLNVSATGVGDLSYQWFRKGQPIVGGTSSVLSLSNLKYTDAGAYQVTVTDSTGTIGSTAAFLNVWLQSARVVAWGNYFGNQFGQSTIPAGLDEVTAVAGASYQSLALKSDGTVVSWGGAVCPPIGLNNAVAIAAGYNYSLALKADGTVVGWGEDAWQQCTFAKGLTNIIAISAQGINSMALKADGTVVAWGGLWYGSPWNCYYQNTVPSSLGNGVVAIAAGESHSLALKADGTVTAWGDNSRGQTSVPPDLTNVVTIAAGANHSLALRSDGTVVAWGWDGYGQCSVPLGLNGVVAIAAGAIHSIALKSDGTVVSWGDVPQGTADSIAIAGGYYHTLAIQAPATPPTDVNTSNNDLLCLGKVHVTWSPAPGATSYQVFRSTAPTGDKDVVSSWQSGTEFYDVPPTRAIPYYYWVVTASDPNNTNVSDFSNSAAGSAALTARDVFSNWMAAQGVSGSPESNFAADRDGDGVVNGLEFAFGENRQNSEPSIIVAPREGSLVVGFLKQADATLPYVDLAIECSTDLKDWSYPLVSVIDTTGLAGNRTWYQPQGSPAKVFFRLEASLKPDPEP